MGVVRVHSVSTCVTVEACAKPPGGCMLACASCAAREELWPTEPSLCRTGEAPCFFGDWGSALEPRVLGEDLLAL